MSSKQKDQQTQELPKDFEALDHNGEPAIPSIVDILPLLAIEETVQLEDFVKAQYKGVSETIKQLKIEKVTAKKALSFLVPLTAYIPLPTPYYASLVSRDEETNEAIGFSCVTLNNYNPRMKLGDKEVLLQLSYALITVASEEFNNTDNKLEEFPDLHKVYDHALLALNGVINSYKATPWRHSHILQAQSALGTPGAVHIIFSEFPTAKIIEKGTISLHDHLIGELYQSRMVNENELNNFRIIHTTDSNGNSFPLWLVSKLNEAIDARCNGKDDSAIIFADHYVELSMRYLLYNVLRTKGLTHTNARARARNHNRIDDLVKDLAVELGQSPTNFKSKIEYSKWTQSCRKKRNALNHEIERSKVTPNESFKAVDTSAINIKKICEVVNSQYPGAMQDTQWMMTATWMTESMKQAKKAKKRG